MICCTTGIAAGFLDGGGTLDIPAHLRRILLGQVDSNRRILRIIWRLTGESCSLDFLLKVRIEGEHREMALPSHRAHSFADFNEFAEIQALEHASYDVSCGFPEHSVCL